MHRLLQKNFPSCFFEASLCPEKNSSSVNCFTLLWFRLAQGFVFSRQNMQDE